MRRAGLALAALAGVAVVALMAVGDRTSVEWSDDELAILRSLALDERAAPPSDPSNRVADDPRAAALGARLFADLRLSGDGQIACATCHQPDRAFTDGRTTAQGMGRGARNTPAIAAAAHGPWYFWDGRRDSQWAQALGPLESPAEHGATRTRLVAVLAAHHRAEYEALFGRLPEVEGTDASPLGDAAARRAWAALPASRRDEIDRAFANLGKTLAAYQRRLRFGKSRFDRHVDAMTAGDRRAARATLSEDERAGLRLFIGKAGCVSCHRGPLFTNHEFFSLGLPFGAAGPDAGRAAAHRLVRADPFNCLGQHSDAPAGACAELRFMSEDDAGFLGAFKTPSLRNVALTAPYMHAGQLATLEEVVEHYDRAPAVPYPEHTDIRPLGLTKAERGQIVAFLRTLTSPVVDAVAPAGIIAASRRPGR